MKDEYIQEELVSMVKQLKTADHRDLYTEVFDKLIKDVEKQKEIKL